MTREDIIRLAQEAGWSGIYTQWAEPTGKPDWSPFKESLTVPVTMKQIERFAALVADAERERLLEWGRGLQVITADKLAKAIQARGK